VGFALDSKCLSIDEREPVAYSLSRSNMPEWVTSVEPVEVALEDRAIRRSLQLRELHLPGKIMLEHFIVLVEKSESDRWY
jgi:hypothetical protein